MRKFILPFIFLALIYTSCKKNGENIVDPPILPEKKVSWWVVDTDTFITKESKRYVDGKYFSLSYFNTTNDTGFSIKIDTTGKNLNNDSFSLHDRNGSVNVIIFNTRYGSHTYRSNDSGTYVYSIRESGKVKFVLPPTIFRRLVPIEGSGGLTPSQDTTIIQGVFYEP